MLGKKETERTLTVIKALLKGYILPYKDTVVALDITMKLKRRYIKDQIIAWIPFIGEEGLDFYNTLAKQLTEEEYIRIEEYLNEVDKETPIQDKMYNEEVEYLHELKENELRCVEEPTIAEPTIAEIKDAAEQLTIFDALQEHEARNKIQEALQ